MVTKKDLSSEQQTALSYLLKFSLNSTDQQMVLAGYAGTGKSSLINVFLKEMDKSNAFLRIYCTAPTNEAVRVISNATGRKYEMTIYSLLGLVLVEESGMKPRIEQKAKSKIDEYDIIVLDEASMIGDELLCIIYTMLKKYPHLKIIYVGDHAQLPPINTSEPIFDAVQGDEVVEQVESSVFKLSNKIELTEVQRVAKNNPIINVVTPIRANLNSKDDCFDRTSYYNEGAGVQFYELANEFAELMYADFLSPEYRKNINYVRVIAYTNKMVAKLNAKIRSKMFDCETPDEFIPGEVLIVASPIVKTTKKNVKEILLSTGERVEVLEVNHRIDDETNLNIWDLSIKKYDSKDDKTFNVIVVSKHSEGDYLELLHSFATKAKKMMAMTKFEDGKYKPVYTSLEAWTEYYTFRDRFCKMKYSYAMTTHTSQGATVERVYVVERDLNILTWNDVIRNKLKYTAFTRASKLLRILM